MMNTSFEDDRSVVGDLILMLTYGLGDCIGWIIVRL